MNSFRSMFGFNTQLIYYLRQNPLNEIYPATQDEGAIFLGNIYAAYSLEILKKHNITAVLTVAAGTNLKYSPEHGIKHMIIMADDIESYNLSRHFEKIVDFIVQCRKEKRNILVHCFAGISRSTTSIVAYMIREKNENYRKVINYIRARRKEINPNAGFMRQLANYEKKIKSSQNDKQSVQYPAINGNNATNRSKSLNNQNQLGLTIKQSPYYNSNQILDNQTLNKNGRNIVMNGKKMNINNNNQDESIKQDNLNQDHIQQQQNQPKIGNTLNNFHYNNTNNNNSNNVVNQPYYQKGIKADSTKENTSSFINNNRNQSLAKKEKSYGLMGQQFKPIQQNLMGQKGFQYKGTLFKNNQTNYNLNQGNNFNNNLNSNNLNKQNNNNNQQQNSPFKVNASQKVSPPKISTVQPNQSTGFRHNGNNGNKMPSPLKIQKVNSSNNNQKNFHYTNGIKKQNHFRDAYVNNHI